MKFLFLMLLAFAQTPPPNFVEKGACPKDCCKFGKWKALKEFSVYDQPNLTKKIATVKKDDYFTGVYGEVHSVPYEVKLTADDGDLKEGETVYLLNYRGEGFYRGWYKGKAVDVFGASTDVVTREKSRPRQSSWWVQVKLEDGRTGWMREAGEFNPSDCKAKTK